MDIRVIKNNQILVEKPLNISIDPVNGEEIYKSIKGSNLITPGHMCETSNHNISKEIEEQRKITEEKSKAIIEKARKEAEEIIAAAAKKAESLLDDARQQGFQAGYEDGYKENEEIRGELNEKIKSVADTAEEKYRESLEKAEADMVDIILGITEKVIYDDIKENKEYVFKLVKKAIERCLPEDNITIKVSAEDFTYLNEKRDELVPENFNSERMNIVKDESLGLGSCIVDTLKGSLDSSVSTRLNNIEKTFREIAPRKVV